MKKTFLFLGALFIASLSAVSQSINPCVDEVLSYENMGKEADSLVNVYFSYSIKATNWDDETVMSNVKVYRMGNNTHIFSEQATIYMDETDALIVMPQQKVLVLNSQEKQDKKNPGVNDEFYKIRKAFLDSCEVVRCEEKTPNYKILVLKNSQKKWAGISSIESMTYEYNPADKKIISIKVTYTNQYKLKQLVMFYKQYDPASTYKFSPAKRYVMDKRGHVLEKYKDYEIVDNRESKTNSKGKS